MFCLRKGVKAPNDNSLPGSKNLIQERLADNNASFLRAARAGNLDKVLEYLKGNIDINTSNSNGLNALHLAAKEGHVNVVTELLKKGANVNAATKKGNTALHIASLAGQEEVVRVLANLGANVNVQSQNGFTPLYMAAQENHDAVVSFLLANGANQSLATEDGFTPLAVALQQGHDKVVAVLLENDTKGRVRLPALHIAAKKDDCKAATLLLQNDHNPDVISKSGFTPLHIAAHYGNKNIAHILLDKGADVNYAAKHQITPLHVASKWGKSNMVQLLVEKGAKVDAVTRDGLTPLHCAARSGHDQVVDLLLEKNAPILAKTKNGLAPLHMASQGDHVDSARILLYHKAPVDDVTVDYLTALHVAAHCGHVKVAKLLLDRKADANARALNGFTPLHIACKKNRIKVVELLLKHGASIEATTESGLSPLHVAAFMGCMNIVIYLIQSGANPDVPTVRGETPLHLAARANQIDIIRILLRNGASVDARAREDQTPLHIAARLGNVDIVSLLLQHGSAVDATTKDMYTALHIAAKEGQEEVVSVLLDHEASLTTVTKRGFTPLHIAAKYGNIKVVRLLLQKDAPVDAQGKNGLTPLHVAAHYNHVNVALLLLEKGASPHAAAKNGFTPLHIAAKKNQMDIATTLLEYGATCNAKSKAGYTPLHLSSQEGHTDITTLLIEHQANVNKKANNGLTPLHLSAQEDRVNVATVLVKNGAEIEPQTNSGYTPLHMASHFGQINMVRFLLQNNADVHASNEHGYTSLHQAAQQGHTPVVTLLLENDASPNAVTSNGQTALSIAQRLGYISVVETLKVVTETTVTTTTTMVTEEKYKVLAPEIMQEIFMTDSEDEGGEDTMLGDQSYRYLTADEMKSLGDDSLPIDVTKDEKQHEAIHMTKESTAPMVEEDKISPQHVPPVELGFSEKFSPDNIDISRAPVHSGFLVSFMVDARGGAMRGCRHSGVRVIIPPRKAAMPMRITCRYLRKEKLSHPPPLMEGEACASRILEVGPIGARFLGPVILEVPHFASLRDREREVTILRSDTGETWREHSLEASEEAVQEVLNESFEGDELNALEDLNTNRITRILTTDFPQYFAIVTRIRQEVHGVGPEGGIVSSKVVPQVQAIFPEGALQKKIRVGLQAQPISPELVTKLLGNRVAVSPIVTVEPRRRKFHKPITLTIPVPQAATKGMINQYSGDAPTLRLLCSITGSTKSGGSSKAQWEDVTGSTPLTFVNDCVSFTTTVSARFWLMDCRQVNEVSRFATELYQEAVHVPFMAKFVIFAKRHDNCEAHIRVFCMTDDKEDKTLETQEHFTEIAKSRDVEVLEGKLQHLEFAGNLVPVTNSKEQLKFIFHAFHENRLPFTIRVKDPHVEPLGRIAFMREAKVGRGEPPQTPICNLNIAMPEVSLTKQSPAILELLTFENTYDFMQEAGLSKPESIHRANLRLSDIARELDKDWVALANELRLSETDISAAKSGPNNSVDQALIMLRLWLQKSDSKLSGNDLEKALRKINREDIINKCMFNVELVTDDVEKAVAKVHLDQSGFDVFKEELGSSREASMRQGTSLDISYDGQDIMKEAESATETSSETGSLFEKDQVVQSFSEDKEHISQCEELLENKINLPTINYASKDSAHLNEYNILTNSAIALKSETFETCESVFYDEMYNENVIIRKPLDDTINEEQIVPLETSISAISVQPKIDVKCQNSFSALSSGQQQHSLDLSDNYLDKLPLESVFLHEQVEVESSFSIKEGTECKMNEPNFEFNSGLHEGPSEVEQNILINNCKKLDKSIIVQDDINVTKTSENLVHLHMVNTDLDAATKNLYDLENSEIHTETPIVFVNTFCQAQEIHSFTDLVIPSESITTGTTETNIQHADENKVDEDNIDICSSAGIDTNSIHERSPRNENIVELDNGSISNPRYENFAELDVENIFEPDAENIFEPDEENIFEPDEENIFESDEENIFEPNEENIFEPDEENIFEPDEETIGKCDKKNALEVDEENIYEPDKENICDPDKENICKSDKENIYKPDKESICETDEENNCEPDMESICVPVKKNIFKSDKESIAKSDENINELNKKHYIGFNEKSNVKLYKENIAKSDDSIADAEESIVEADENIVDLDEENAAEPDRENVVEPDTENIAEPDGENITDLGEENVSVPNEKNGSEPNESNINEPDKNIVEFNEERIAKPCRNTDLDDTNINLIDPNIDLSEIISSKKKSECKLGEISIDKNNETICLEPYHSSLENTRVSNEKNLNPVQQNDNLEIVNEDAVLKEKSSDLIRTPTDFSYLMPKNEENDDTKVYENIVGNIELIPIVQESRSRFNLEFECDIEESKISKVTKSPPCSPCKISEEKILKYSVELIPAESDIKVGDVAAKILYPKALKMTDSETWPSGEMDTSQVSVSSLPDDEKSEPSNITVSSVMAEVDSETVQSTIEDMQDGSKITLKETPVETADKTLCMTQEVDIIPTLEEKHSQESDGYLVSSIEKDINSKLYSVSNTAQCAIIPSVSTNETSAINDDCLEINPVPEVNIDPTILAESSSIKVGVIIKHKDDKLHSDSDSFCISQMPMLSESLCETSFASEENQIVTTSITRVSLLSTETEIWDDDKNEQSKTTSKQTTEDTTDEQSLKIESNIEISDIVHCANEKVLEDEKYVEKESLAYSIEKPSMSSSGEELMLVNEHEQIKVSSQRATIKDDCSSYPQTSDEFFDKNMGESSAKTVYFSCLDIGESGQSNSNEPSENKLTKSASTSSATVSNTHSLQTNDCILSESLLKNTAESFIPLAFDNTAFVGADAIDASVPSIDFRSRSPYEVVRDEHDFGRCILEKTYSTNTDNISDVLIYESHLALEKQSNLKMYSVHTSDTADEIRSSVRRKPILQNIPSEIAEEDLFEIEASSPCSKAQQKYYSIDDDSIECSAEIKKNEIESNFSNVTLSVSAHSKSCDSINESQNNITYTKEESNIETQYNSTENLEQKDSSLPTSGSFLDKGKLSSPTLGIQSMESLSINNMSCGFQDYEPVEILTDNDFTNSSKNISSAIVFQPKYEKASLDQCGAVGGLKSEPLSIIDTEKHCLDQVTHLEQISCVKQFHKALYEGFDAEIKKVLHVDIQLEEDIIERPQTPEPPVESVMYCDNKENFHVQHPITTRSKTTEKLVPEMQNACYIAEEESSSERDYINLDIDDSLIGLDEAEGDLVECSSEIMFEPEKSGLRKMGSFKDISTVHLKEIEGPRELDIDFIPSGKGSVACSSFAYGMQFERDIDDHSEEAMDIDNDQFGDEKEIVYAYGMRFERDHDLEDEDVPPYGDLYTHHEEDEEDALDEIEKVKGTTVMKTDFDILAGRKFFTKSSELDDVSMSSLQEFERLEEEIRSGRRSSIGSIDSLNGKHYPSKSGDHDDVSMNSLTEFEKLERECSEAERMEAVLKEANTRLFEIEEGHESQTSETSQETSEASKIEYINSHDNFSNILRIRVEEGISIQHFKEKYSSVPQPSSKFVNATIVSDAVLDALNLNEITDDNEASVESKSVVLTSKETVALSSVSDENVQQGSKYVKVTQSESSYASDVEQDSLHDEKSIKPDSLSTDNRLEFQDSLHEDKSDNLDSLQDVKDEMHDSLHEERLIDDDSLHEMDILPDESSLSLESSIAAVIDVSHDSLCEKYDIHRSIAEQDFDADSLKGMHLSSTFETALAIHGCDITAIQTCLSGDLASSTDSLEQSTSAAVRAAYQYETESVMSSSLNSIQTTEDSTMISSTDTYEHETSIPFSSFPYDVKALSKDEKENIFQFDSEGNIPVQEFSTFIQKDKDICTVLKPNDKGALPGNLRTKFNGKKDEPIPNIDYRQNQQDDPKLYLCQTLDPNIEIDKFETVDDLGNSKSVEKVKHFVHRSDINTFQQSISETKLKELNNSFENVTYKCDTAKEQMLGKKESMVSVRTISEEKLVDTITCFRPITGDESIKHSDNFVKVFASCENIDEDGNIVRISQVTVNPEMKTFKLSGRESVNKMDMKEWREKSGEFITAESTSSDSFIHSYSSSSKKSISSGLPQVLQEDNLLQSLLSDENAIVKDTATLEKIDQTSNELSQMEEDKQTASASKTPVKSDLH